jgi:Ohr subfamily peroxiredoxin
MSIETVLYRAHANATGGRDGRGITDDGRLDVRLATPRELGGAGGEGTNPEQLFAVGYSACFLGAMKFVAARDKLRIPAWTAPKRKRSSSGPTSSARIPTPRAATSTCA